MVADLAKTSNKWDYLPIGTPGQPWPNLIRREVNGVTSFKMGTVESETHPIMFLSSRNYEDVMPDLYMRMPVPGMLDAFNKVTASKLVYFESDPGYGKSFLSEQIGYAMHEKGAIRYDAGGKNMQSLLVETVFDSRRSKDMVDQVDKALAANELNQLSLKELGSLMGGEKNDTPFLKDENGVLSFDWQGLKNSNIEPEKIREVFNAVKVYQQWNGSLNVGFEDRPGALIQAAMENRPLVIDEFPRRKPGTEGPLQMVWQVLSGEMDEIVIPLGNLGNFTLKKGDIPLTMLSGNKVKDGPDVTPISDSLASRLTKVDIPKFNQRDWQHRIEQLIVGLPISTLARLVPGKLVDSDGVETWQPNSEKDFGDSLVDLKKQNKRVVPAFQLDMLRNWQDVSLAAAKLAQAYFKTEMLLDPDSEALQKADMFKIKSDVTLPGDMAEKLTPRQPLHHLAEALKMAFEVKETSGSRKLNFSNFRKPVLKPSDEAASKNYGDRLKGVLEKWLCDICGVTPEYTKRPELYKQLQKVWKEAGILGENSILQKLNIKPVTKEKVVVGADATRAAELVNMVVRSKYPGASAITPEEAEMFLSSLSNLKTPKLEDGKFIDYATVNFDPASIADRGLQVETGQVTIPDYKNNEDLSSFSSRIKPQNTMSEQKLLATLAMPVIGPRMLRSLCEIGQRPVEPYLKMAAASTEVPVAFTTVVCNSGDKFVRLHYIYNHEKKEGLVIRPTPGEIDPALKQQLAKSGITYVSAQAPEAETTVRDWLGKNLAGLDKELKQAFDIRNDVHYSLPEEFNTIKKGANGEIDPQFRLEKSKALLEAFEKTDVVDMLLNKVPNSATLPSLVQTTNVSRSA